MAKLKVKGVTFARPDVRVELPWGRQLTEVIPPAGGKWSVEETANGEIAIYEDGHCIRKLGSGLIGQIYYERPVEPVDGGAAGPAKAASKANVP